MNVKEERICRLCLKEAENDFEIINEITRKIFEVILLTVNLDLSKDPVICKDCAQVTVKCFNFKSICMDNEELISSSAIDKKIAMFELKNEYKNGKNNIETVDDNSVCRFCSNHLSGCNFVLLATLMNDVKFAEMLQVIMPEMDFCIIKNLLICTSCKQDLECYIKLVENSLDVEEKITKYIQNEGTPSSGQVKLSDIQRFSFQTRPIKQQEDIHSEIYDELIKTEKIDMKYEELNYIEPACETPSDYTKCINTNNTLEAQIFKCATCIYETKEKGQLETHMLIHKDITEVEMYKCTMCTFQTKHKGSVKKHMLVHKDITEVQMYKCLKCTFQTKYSGSFDQHILTHKDIVTAVKIHKCSICTFQTKVKSSLNKHIRLKHEDNVEMFKCSKCTFETKYKESLVKHMLIHKDITEVEMYKCSMCTFETKRKGNLKKHMVAHKDRKGNV